MKNVIAIAGFCLTLAILPTLATAATINVSNEGNFEYSYNSWNNTSSETDSGAYEADFDRPGGWVWKNDGSNSFLYPTSWSTKEAATPTDENFSIEFQLDEGLTVDGASVSYNMLLSSHTHDHMRLAIGVGVFDENGNETVTRIDEAERTGDLSEFVVDTTDISDLLQGEDRFVIYGWRETTTSDTSVTQRDGHQFFRQGQDNPSFNVNLTSIPEPGTVTLMSLGALCVMRRRLRSSK